MKAIMAKIISLLVATMLLVAACALPSLLAPFDIHPSTARVTPAAENPPSIEPDGQSTRIVAAASASATPAPTPTLIPATLDDARRHWRNGDLPLALAMYRQLAASPGASGQLWLELGIVEQANGQNAAARDTFGRLLATSPASPLKERARFLLAITETSLGAYEPVLGLDGQSAPDGLADLVVLRRADALVLGGKLDQAKVELSRPEVRESSNRILLERAAELADLAGDPGLAADMYLRALKYPAWSAEKMRMQWGAAAALVRAGRLGEAVDMFRAFVEVYTWSKTAELAASELERLGAITPFHRGLMASNAGKIDAAKAFFTEAAAGGPYSASAQRRLRQMEESAAWSQAVTTNTAEAFRSYRQRYPGGDTANEAWFREGFDHYLEGRLTIGLGVWSEAAGVATGDDKARLQMWMGKTLIRLGREAEGKAQWQAAAGTTPSTYYALRSRDLLAGITAWPSAVAGRYTLPTGGANQPSTQDPPANPDWEARSRRGLGLLELGMRAEAAAELDALIADADNPAFLVQLADTLTTRSLWSSAARAANRAAGLLPAKTLAGAPLAVRRLAFPAAYSDLVCAQSAKYGVDPLLLLSLIRQESIYDPLAISVSDARGLTQVIPATGRGIAANLNRQGFAPADLFRPAVSVEFGAAYLAENLKRFGGDAFKAAAAYNAGPGPVPRWATSDPDLFVERIDYSQTRNYVRGVYTHHSMYRSLERELSCAGQ